MTYPNSSTLNPASSGLGDSRAKPTVRKTSETSAQRTINLGGAINHPIAGAPC
jgi:hypothetical protein